MTSEFQSIVSAIRAEVKSDALNDALAAMLGDMERALCTSCRGYAGAYDAVRSAVAHMRAFSSQHGFALHEFARQYEELALRVLNASDAEQGKWCNEACIDAYGYPYRDVDMVTVIGPGYGVVEAAPSESAVPPVVAQQIVWEELILSAVVGGIISAGILVFVVPVLKDVARKVWRLRDARCVLLSRRCRKQPGTSAGAAAQPCRLRARACQPSLAVLAWNPGLR